LQAAKRYSVAPGGQMQLRERWTGRDVSIVAVRDEPGAAMPFPALKDRAKLRASLRDEVGGAVWRR